mmetsp:Transcript_12964/g.25848  ORF Transcript_12964/g.25848 Transcript_12964/m.25848 type:complete len:256 (+) Transcript_12964:41-808(+)
MSGRLPPLLEPLVPSPPTLRLRWRFCFLFAFSSISDEYFFTWSRSGTSSWSSSSRSSSPLSSSASWGIWMRMLYAGISISCDAIIFSGAAAASGSRGAAWSPSTESMRRISFASHCASTSTTVESVITTASCSTVMGSSLSARCSTPLLTLMRILAMRSYFCLLRSHLLFASDRCDSNSSTIRRDPSDPVPEYLISSTLALACAFSSFNASIRACASFVITTRLLCVSSWVRNFWMTSLTSETPVASLIFRNASS